MTPDELRARTKSFALRVMKLYRSLPAFGGCASDGQATAAMRNFGRGELPGILPCQIASRICGADWNCG